MSRMGRNSYLQSLAHPESAVSAPGVGGSRLPVLTPSVDPKQLGPQSSSLLIYPWWDQEYDSAQDWMVEQRAFTLAASATNSAITGISFTVPANARAVLKQFLMEILSPTTATDVFLTLLRNEQPIPGWSRVPYRSLPAAYQGLPYNGLNLRFD